MSLLKILLAVSLLFTADGALLAKEKAAHGSAKGHKKKTASQSQTTADLGSDGKAPKIKKSKTKKTKVKKRPVSSEMFPPDTH